MKRTLRRRVAILVVAAASHLFLMAQHAGADFPWPWPGS